MAIKDSTPAEVLGAFYDEGAYSPLFSAPDQAVTAAYGFAGGQPVYTVYQNGQAVSAKDLEIGRRTMHLAAKTGNPVVTFYNTVGSKLEDGLAAMSAAAKLNQTIAKLSGVVPQIAVVIGVCGATSALSATGADLCIMAADAELFLTAPFLSAVEGDKMKSAGTSKAAAEAGVAAVLAEDAIDAARKAAQAVALLPSNNLAVSPRFAYDEPAPVTDWTNLNGLQAIEALVDAGSAMPLYQTFGEGIVVALATIGGAVTGVVATDGEESYLERNSASKAARFVRLCDAFSIPVVTLINTGGFAISSHGDVAGNIRKATRLAATYADATTARIAVITGKAVGPAYTALANADIRIALEGAVMGPAEPSAAVTVLYKDEIMASGNPVQQETEARVAQYIKEVAGAQPAQAAGLVDNVATAQTVRGNVMTALDMLVSKREQRLPKKHSNLSL